jgi:hypothetical protein
MEDNKPSTYNPDLYVIEGYTDGSRYHKNVGAIQWYFTVIVSFPLRFLPLFKHYKYVYQRNKVLIFRSKQEVNF